jgi:hypothetical protein
VKDLRAVANDSTIVGGLHGLFGCGDGMPQISSDKRQQHGYRQKESVQQPEVE